MSTNTMLDVSQSPSKKADQDLENIRFCSLGWPTEKQSTLAGLPTVQSTPANSYPDNSDLRLIRTCLRPPFRKNQGNIPVLKFEILFPSDIILLRRGVLFF